MITLLKHEFLQTRAWLGLVGLVALLVAAVGGLFAATGWPGLAQLGTVLAIVAVVAVVPAAQIVLAVAYWRSSYGRMGYLTQTFPLKGSAIYRAKLVWAFLVSLAGVVLSVGIALAAAPLLARGAGIERGDLVAPLREGWSLLVDMAPAWAVVAAVAALAMLVLMWPVQYFFAASIGSQAPLNRMGVGGPVIVWLGVYFVTQVLSFVSFVAVPYAIGVEGDRLTVVRFDLFAEISAGTSADVMPIGFLPALLLTVLVCAGWTVRSWNRQVSLV